LFSLPTLWRLSLAAGLVLISAAAHAQFRASIQGTVTDPSGAVIPNAKVTLKDNATNSVQTATSNESGVYSFNGLPPARFTLMAEAPGFTQKSIQDLTIIPEQANSVNIQLAVGEASTSVSVSAETLPPLDTATANLQGVVNSNEIQHLPSSGRDVFQLAQLAPGAIGDAAHGAGGGTRNLPGSQGPGGTGATTGIFQTENQAQTLSGGGQVQTNGISIDGISTSSAVWGGATVITPSEDSVDNVKIGTNVYDAEIGRFSGTQMQVTSKSGTNQLHGSLFFRVNRPGLNAYQRYNGPVSLGSGTPIQRGLQRDTARFNQFGGSIGGPIWKDRVFAFFAYETLRNGSNSTANGWYDTAAFDALAPGNGLAKRFVTFAGHEPSNGTLLTSGNCTAAGLTEGVNCRTIAGQGIDIGSPLKAGLGAQDLGWTGASNPGVGGGLDGVADIAEYQTSSPFNQTSAQYNGRLDANVSQKDHLAFAIYWVPSSTQQFNGPQRAYNLFNHDQTNDAFSVIWNHTFSPSFLNEARANAAGYRFDEIASNPQEPFGLPQANINTTGSASINFFGTPGPGVYNQWTYTYRDVATKVAGNHTIKFGGEVTRLYYLNENVAGARPQFTFFNLWDFLNDAPFREQGTFDRRTGTPSSNRFDDRENLFGFFVQDDWKASPSLTFNLGLRYSYFGSLYTKQNNISSVRFGSGPALFTGMYIERGGHLWNPQKGNLGPQFGFAWSPLSLKNKAVVRGGFGLNYNQEQIAITGQASNNPGDAVSPVYDSPNPTSINKNIVYALPTDASTIFGYPPNPNTITSYNSVNLPTQGGLTLTAFPTNMPTAYTYHYSLDTQVDLGYQLVASVGYQGSAAHHLISQQNIYVYGQGQGYAFNPLVSGVNYYYNENASNYNALLVTLKHNMSHQFSANADFTWSKSMDDGSGPYQNDPYPYNPVYARGRSDFNIGKALKIYGLWQPVFFRGNHSWMEKIAGGWSVSGIFNLHTGFPWTPVYNTGAAYYANSGYSTFRPTYYTGRAGQNFSNNGFKPGPDGNSPNFQGGALIKGGTGYFTAPVVTSSSFPAPGIARNSFTGPGYKNLDATLTKAFGLPNLPVLGERANLEIRADAFNLFNITNLDGSQINNDIGTTQFGVARAALGARVVNLQARFNF
jgi:hypothetical protein